MEIKRGAVRSRHANWRSAVTMTVQDQMRLPKIAAMPPSRPDTDRLVTSELKRGMSGLFCFGMVVLDFTRFHGKEHLRHVRVEVLTALAFAHCS